MVTITASFVGVAAAITIVILIRRDRLRVRYVIWWFEVAIIVAVLSVFTHIVSMVGVAQGIRYPPALALTLGLVLLVLTIPDMVFEHCVIEPWRF